MTKKKSGKRKYLLIGAISVVYFLYITVFVKPWNFQNFSLVDDGQVLLQSSSYLEDCVSKFECSKFIDQIFELGTGRFRPSYWLINNINYEIFGNSARDHHIYRAYVIGYIGVLSLALILISMEIDWLIIFISVSLFYTSFSFSENIIRLGTNEPYQVIFLAICSYLYLKGEKLLKTRKRYYFILTTLLIWTVLIKENNIAILLAIFATELFFRKGIIPFKKILLIVSPFAVLVLGILFSKILPSSISTTIPEYTSNYITNFTLIFKNALANISMLNNSLSTFLKLSILTIPFLFLNNRVRTSLKQKDLCYWLFFTIFFTGILFPWRHVLERYQLVAVFGLVIIMGFLLNRGFHIIKEELILPKITRSFMGIILYSLTFILMFNIFARGFSINLAKTINYRDWFLGFTTFEADQVKVIAKYNNQGIFINGKENINTWEFLYEIPIHMKYLYKIDYETKIIGERMPTNGYLFSRRPFDMQVSIDDVEKLKYKKIEFREYSINQIDPIKFREKFILRPIETCLKPPMKEDSFEYYWEIREL